MDREDLLRLLDLDGRDEPGERAADDLLAPAAPTPSAATCPQALEVDEWGSRRGRDLLAEHPALGRRGIEEEAMADFHTAAFVPDPRLTPGCVDPLRQQFVTQLLETPEYHALHATTMLHEAAAALAAFKYAEQFAALREECQEARPEESKPEEKTPGGKTPRERPLIAPGGTARRREGPGADEEMAVLRAVGRALAEATAEVAECRGAAAALGLGPGAPGSTDPRAIATLYRRVRSSPTLRAICAQAGRFRRLAQSKQRQKATHGLDDVVGVELGGDLGRLLPGELARLVLPECELDTLRRLAERQAMQRLYRATEPAGQGPILVTVDESGSMAGEKAHTAKALALALAWIARQQRRWCGLVAYSGDTGERCLALRPGRWDEGAVMDWIEPFLGGGSDLDVPVRELPRIYQDLRAPAGRTDVICITDAVCHIPPQHRASFLAWKQAARARLITLVIGSEPGDLVAISDEFHRVAALDPASDAVGRVLSL
jgi:uncharacterized protein with von Willebrand factor type A (vWA) domain